MSIFWLQSVLRDNNLYGALFCLQRSLFDESNNAQYDGLDKLNGLH